MKPWKLGFLGTWWEAVLILVGAVGLYGAYLLTDTSGVSFAVRSESAVVRQADETDRTVAVIPTPGGGFFLVDDVFGPHLAPALVPGKPIGLSSGAKLRLPGYQSVSVLLDNGSFGWRIRPAWWLRWESFADGVPVEYGSLADESLVRHLTPPPKDSSALTSNDSPHASR